MNVVVRLLIVICACAAGHAVADPSESQPSAAVPAGVTGAQTPAPASSPASTTATAPADTASHPSASKPNKVVLQDETLNGEQLKQILSMGYKPEGHGDQVLYCRRESQMGTRFETKVCRTATVILGVEQQGRDITNRAQQNNGNPTLK